MAPKEFRGALKDLGISQREFARDIEADVTTVNRWATGKAEMSGAAKAYLKLRMKVKDFTFSVTG